MRWKIEVFHKFLKFGCRTEDARLRTADRLANVIAVFCIISWRVLWLTMLAPNRKLKSSIKWSATQATGKRRRDRYPSISPSWLVWVDTLQGHQTHHQETQSSGGASDG